MKRILTTLVMLLTILSAASIHANAQTYNYDEAKAGTYQLPELLRTTDGARIPDRKAWEQKRRPEIISLYTQEVYGRMPGKPAGMQFRTIITDPDALGGKAIRKEIDIIFGKATNAPVLHLVLWLPKDVKKAPVFIGLNFMGNHSVHYDPKITVTDTWKQAYPGKEVQRGIQATRWQVDTLIAHGYGLATAWYQDLEPDRADGWKTGIRSTLAETLDCTTDAWGALAVWGWGMSRMMDCLEKEPGVDARKVIATGHSRLGKAALWGAANDQRFAMIVSNNSGEGGAALSRRDFGETVKRINTSFPHWFIAPYKKYNDSVNNLPVDQHMLLALMAPRPLYVASAAEDLWADPTGEYLSAFHAGPVYALYGKKGLSTPVPPATDSPVAAAVSYHRRTGKHDVTLYDWQQYIAWADRHLKKGK
jgi:hypothetical protein